VCVCVYVYVCMYVCMYVYMYVCMYVCNVKQWHTADAQAVNIRTVRNMWAETNHVMS
jgi:DNA phosphorothioation-dependent restriction protein DptG